MRPAVVGCVIAVVALGAAQIRAQEPSPAVATPSQLAPLTAANVEVPPRSELPPATTAAPLEERLGLKPTIEVRGRIEVDASLVSQSAQSQAVIGDLQNGYGFRRVRLGAQGTIGSAAKWVSEVELAGGNVRLRDVYIGLTDLPGVRDVNIGYFREPFSLEGMTSSNYLTFMERSQVGQLSPARNWGLCGYWWPDDERVTFAVGTFRDGTNSTGQSVGDQSAWAVTTRLTGLPVYEPDADVFRLVHLGGAFSQRNPVDGQVTYAPSPGSNLLTVNDNPSSPFLPPVTIPANSQQIYNLQAALVTGPFSAQAEWTGTAVQQTNAGVVFLHGFYMQACYFLTGEHRRYNRTRGAFDGVSVRRPLLKSPERGSSGLGAVEVATRFTLGDFNSADLPPATDGSPTAATLYQMTFAVNWYLNDYTRLMFNYSPTFPVVIGKPQVSAHLFTLRTAIYW